MVLCKYCGILWSGKEGVDLYKIFLDFISNDLKIYIGLFFCAIG